MEDIDRDNPNFNQCVQHVVDLLAKTIGAEGWVSGDGSEDYDSDLQQTLLNILEAKGLFDPENGSYANTAKQIATDLLDAMAFHHGQEGLAKIVRHIKTVNIARETRSQIDDLEEFISTHEAVGDQSSAPASTAGA